MSNTKWYPHPDYPFWLYDPEGDGFTFYSTAEARDEAAKEVIKLYINDGWDPEVEGVAAGVITHIAAEVDRVDRPPDSELDEEGCDENGEYWGPDYLYRCGYELRPIGGRK